MADLLGVIDPNRDRILIGPVEVTGFADDDMITISRNEDITNTFVGTKGDITVVTNPNSVGTVTIRLQETSPTNAQLFAALAAIQVGSVDGILTFSAIRESSSILPVTRAWLQTQPDISYGKETNIYEWVLTLENATMDLGALTGTVNLIS